MQQWKTNDGFHWHIVRIVICFKTNNWQYATGIMPSVTRSVPAMFVQPHELWYWSPSSGWRHSYCSWSFRHLMKCWYCSRTTSRLYVSLRYVLTRAVQNEQFVIRLLVYTTKWSLYRPIVTGSHTITFECVTDALHTLTNVFSLLSNTTWWWWWCSARDVVLGKTTSTRKPYCCKETARCRSCSFRFKIRRQLSLQA